MKSDHPITPPPELMEHWLGDLWPQDALQAAAQWGADQELEACCAYLVRCAQWEPEDVDELHVARRPKPPSLKEQALEQLESVQCLLDMHKLRSDAIRRAIEALHDD